MLVASKLTQLMNLSLESCDPVDGAPRTDSTTTAGATALIENHYKFTPTLASLALCKLDISDTLLTELLTHHTALTSLEITSCSRITNSAVKLIGKHSPTLTELTLKRLGVTDSALIDIGKQCPDLATFTLAGCVVNMDRTLEHFFTSCTKIRTLNIELKDNSLSQYSGLLYISHVLHLTLNSWEYRCVSDFTMDCILENCKELLSLNVRYNSVITDQTLFLVAKYCEHLQRLDIGFCDRVSDAGVTEVLYECMKLTACDLSGCLKVTNKLILSCPKKFPHVLVTSNGKVNYKLT